MQPTTEELAFADDVRRRDKALRRWMGERNSYRTEDVPVRLRPLVTNVERSRAECICFRAEPLPYGQTYYAYLKCDAPRGDSSYPRAYRIATWMGDTLATVTSLTSRPERRSWLTNERGSFWARGIDGRLYHGRHNGAGMHCTLRLAKHQN